MSIVGTPLNMSPEILQRRPYTVKADVWSLGVVAYELLCGYPAFVGKSKDHLNQLIEKGLYSVPKRLGLSVEALDFISSCVQHLAGDRPDWKKLAEHPFICSDTVTPFLFEKFKEKNQKAVGDAKCYTFSSKIHYDFSSMYPPKESPIPEQGPSKDSEFELVDNEIDEKLSNEYVVLLSLIHICRCRRYAVCRSRWSPYH
eukprot:TRINITY_DN12985_c0_g1_i5.p2 TRINITY_DN12985_c0_g1~~TRINITY_DN12985_c0_g1_i5.p2  ORF type:complete len:200 (-),score=46.13 TRINITY_DN12985_c0_g1_i5:21-620(-)